MKFVVFSTCILVIICFPLSIRKNDTSSYTVSYVIKNKYVMRAGKSHQFVAVFIFFDNSYQLPISITFSSGNECNFGTVWCGPIFSSQILVNLSYTNAHFTELA